LEENKRGYLLNDYADWLDFPLHCGTQRRADCLLADNKQRKGSKDVQAWTCLYLGGEPRR